MNKIIGKILLLVLCVTAFSSASYAKGLVISPKRVVFEKGQRSIDVILANRGDETQTYRISVINRKMLENGQLAETDVPAEGEFFAKDYLRYSPRQVVLGPKETQRIRLLSRLKADADEGEYRSHLLIQEVPKAEEAKGASDKAGVLGINVQAIFGMSVPVIMRKGDLSAQAKLSSPKIKMIGKDKYLELAVEREGSKSILGTLNAYIGSEKIGVLKTVAVYMSNAKRIVAIKLDPERAQNISGKEIRVTLGAEEQNEDAPKAELVFTAP